MSSSIRLTESDLTQIIKQVIREDNLTPKIKKLKEIINAVNNGEWEDYSQYFNNDMELFIKIIIKYDLIDLIDPMSDGLQDYQNDILYVLVNQNPEKWINFICETVIDKDLVKQGDDWYLHLNDPEDLGDLFYDGNRDSTKNLVKSVLGEDSWEPYWDTTDDVYRDVVEELNDENLKNLYNIVLKEVEGDTVSTYTDYLEGLDESGSGEVVVTKENFGRMFQDEQTLKHILKKYANEVRQELYNLHSSCYNSVYESKIYGDIWSELSTFFEGKIKWESRPYKSDPDRTQYFALVKIKNIEFDIKHFLSEMKSSNYSQDSLEYYGSYMGMLKNGMDNGAWDILDFRVPDYPNSTQVDKCINDDFGNYL